MDENDYEMKISKFTCKYRFDLIIKAYFLPTKII